MMPRRSTESSSATTGLSIARRLCRCAPSSPPTDLPPRGHPTRACRHLPHWRTLDMTLDTEIVEDLRKAEHLKHDFLVRVLSSLVQTRSVNPGIYEEAMAKRVATWLEGTPAEVNFVESLPGRHSVGAVLDSGRPGPAIVLN